MLVLSRKIGESIVIGGGIVIRVLEVNGGRIRLGVEAPVEVVVRRSELAPTPPTVVRATRPCHSGPAEVANNFMGSLERTSDKR
jgi:carbon storage regulator